MEHRSKRRGRTVRLLAAVALSVPFSVTSVVAQDAGKNTLEVKPESLDLQVGEKAVIEARVLDPAGKPIEDEQVFFFSRARRSVTVDAEGNVEALKPGSYTIIARTRRQRRDPDSEEGSKLGERLSVEIAVEVRAPALEKLEIASTSRHMYAGTSVILDVSAIDVTSAVRDGVAVRWWSSVPEVASFDDFGTLTAHEPGAFLAVAEAEGLRANREMEVVENPIAKIELSVDQSRARTGDVVHITAAGKTSAGEAAGDVPIFLSFVARPDDDLGAPASGQIEQDGRFVAETPGLYTILATSGNTLARANVQVTARNVEQGIEIVGHGEVFETHTSDLWVFEGADGRDYAVTGTWGANGDALFFDVTDPTKIERISSVSCDARTVNDVKVSEDGKLCIISREGASSRKNGIVLVDVENPREPKVLSEFTDDLTGGVHNVFIEKGYCFALSAGRRYDIIDISDPTKPHRVGTFELETDGHSIHDVWVEDGIAYSSNWSDGVQIVDVGNGVAGGTPQEPVLMGSYAYPSGWNHAAFPYHDQQTGKRYVIAGDEAFPYGLHVEDKPTYPRGWLHFIDFTDMENPVEVARYEVPEAGSHNLWVDGDMLYAAFYNGGLRVVDISGELMGDIYRQGREIAWYLPSHPEGYIPNAPMVWGPQPYKGHIFFSDWNTGIWAVKLVPKRRN